MKTFNSHKPSLLAKKSRFFGGAGLFRKLLGSATLALLAWVPAYAQIPGPSDPLSLSGPDVQEQFQEITIEQKIDAQVPLDLTFKDEAGQDVRLGDLLGDTPAVLALVYYECPMLCTEVLNGMVATFGALKFDLGKDFNVITVSIDPGETPELATAKKAHYLEGYGRPGAEAGWHFLTGDEGSIETLATTVGFRYAYDPTTDQYAHAGGIMVLTPGGKISRYFYGIEYLPRDIQFGLTEASEGKIGSVVDQITLLCFLYDPTTGTYGFYVIGAMRVVAVATVLALCAFWLVHYVRGRARTQEGQPVKPIPNPESAVVDG